MSSLLRERTHDKKQQKEGEKNVEHSTLALAPSSLSFDLAPKLVLIPPRTNLYDTPVSWLLKPNNGESALARVDSLATFIENQENGSNEAPDFAADNRLLRELLSWRFSDKMVSVVIQKFGNTLVLQGMSPLFTGPPPCLPQYAASLVSGFDILEPEASLASSRTAAQTTSLEEQARLKAKATEEMLSAKSRKKNMSNQRKNQLLSKLHCRIMEQNEFRALRAEDCLSIHQWHHRDHCVALTSDVMVYSHKKRLTSLYLRDEKEGPHSRASVARLFLDNVMAGVPQLAICWHEDGVIRKYDTMKTNDIPQRLGAHDLDPSELEKTATALLSFLKSACTDDLSVHWLFKGEGDHVARLWRLDPTNDCSLDWSFREKVLYQLAMFCLRASHQNAHRRLELLTKCVEMLDAAAGISLEYNPGVHNLRRSLRAGIRERIIDIITQESLAWSSSADPTTTTPNKVESLLFALESASLAIDLIEDEEEREIPGSAKSGASLIARMRIRLSEKRLSVLKACLHHTQRVLSMAGEGGIGSEVLDQVRRASDEALQAYSTQNVPDVELLGECRALMGGLLMRMAKVKLQDQGSEWTDVDALLSEAANVWYKGAEDCAGDELERTRVLGLRGSALNERGKLRLARGSLFDAIRSFRCALEVFAELGESPNVLLIRGNIAHCYRVAAAHVRVPGDEESKPALLRLAETELELGLSEAKKVGGLDTLRDRLKEDLFRTRIQLGMVFNGQPQKASEALEVFQRASECATSEEDLSWVNFYIGSTHLSISSFKGEPRSATGFKLAKRHLQRSLEATSSRFSNDALRVRVLCALAKLEERPEIALRMIAFDEQVLASHNADPTAIAEYQQSVSHCFQEWIQGSKTPSNAQKAREAYKRWLDSLKLKSSSSTVIGELAQRLKASLS